MSARRPLGPLDLPPLWTLAAAGSAWLLERLAPTPWPTTAMPWLGAAIVGSGVALSIWAAAVMLRAKTDVLPKQAPSALVVAGPFRFSRNPIYLSDIVMVLGVAPLIGSLWPILTAALLVVLLDRRFIRGEEAALRAAFPEAFDAWSRRVRRWI